MSDTYKFRKRGNEEQYKHNQKVFIKMKEANNQIETDNLSQENVNAIKRNISEGTRIDHFIDEAIQDSGIDVDSSLYELYPKLCELFISSKSDSIVLRFPSYETCTCRTWIHQSWLSECLIEISVNLGYSSEILPSDCLTTLSNCWSWNLHSRYWR
jgi:hypothetical protein